jgi:D-amino-acid dehydrogenase
MRENPVNKRVVVIGAGIVGVCCAAFLQREGYAVTLIDRLPPGQGCSYGSAAGVVVCAIEPPIHYRTLTKIPAWLIDPLGGLTIRWRYLPKILPWLLAAGHAAMPDRVKAITEARAALCFHALSDHRNLLADAGASDMLRVVDGIKLFDTEAQWRADEPGRRIQAGHGFSPRQLTPGEVNELEPDVARDFHCGRFHGGWYHVTNPYKIVRAIAENVARQGGKILEDDVQNLVCEGRRVRSIRLAGRGEMPVDNLVIAAGAYSNQLSSQLGTKVMLEAERGYHLTIPRPGIVVGRTVTWAPHMGAMVPLDEGLRIAGTDEFAGLEAPPNWRRADVLWKMGRRVFPALRDLDDTVLRWMGRRPGTPDSLPIIDQAPGMANAWFAFGHSHLGLTWGPTTGRLVAELVAGKSPSMDMKPYRAQRPGV